METTTGASAVDPSPRLHRELILRRLRRLMVAVYFLDVAVLTSVLLVAWRIRLQVDVLPLLFDTPVHLATALAPWILLVWLISIAAQGGYSLRQFGAGAEEFRSIVVASIITVGLLGLFCYLFQVPLSRRFVLLVFLIGTPALLVERYVVRKVVHALRVRGRLLRRVVAVGGPTGIREVADVLDREKYVGYDVVGVVLPPDLTDQAGELDLPVLGTTDEIRAVCDRTGSDTVLVARGGYKSAQEMRRIAWALENTDIDMVVVPSLTDIAGPRISMRPVAGLPLLHLEPPQAGRAGGLSKRLFDLIGATGVILMTAPLMAAIALLIKLEDGGPVFFAQERVGLKSGVFRCLKFRSMRVNADQEEARLRDQDGHAGALWKRQDDPRVTRVGAFIRRYSIDELPQLFNVVAGQMSLVGPRPQQAWEVDSYQDPGYFRRLLVRPGMTGLWQVSGRSELSWNEAVRLDLYYVDNWSMATDLVIMAKTVRAVLRSAGAY